MLSFIARELRVNLHSTYLAWYHSHSYPYTSHCLLKRPNLPLLTWISCWCSLCWVRTGTPELHCHHCFHNDGATTPPEMCDSDRAIRASCGHLLSCSRNRKRGCTYNGAPVLRFRFLLGQQHHQHHHHRDCQHCLDFVFLWNIRTCRNLIVYQFAPSRFLSDQLLSFGSTCFARCCCNSLCGGKSNRRIWRLAAKGHQQNLGELHQRTYMRSSGSSLHKCL